MRREDFDDVPIKPPRVFKEINEFYGPDTYFVTAIGLYQIWSGQHQKAHRPRHYQVCGQAGPLGWEIPAAIGVKAPPGRGVVGIVGDYSFQFLVEELAVGAQYDVPFVLIMVNNEYLGLIRKAELGYDMNYEVDLHYDESGIDHVSSWRPSAARPAGRAAGGHRRALEWARWRPTAPAAGARGDHDGTGGATPRWASRSTRSRSSSRCRTWSR